MTEQEAWEQWKHCEDHCKHDAVFMEYDDVLEKIICDYPVGFPCEYCGHVPCGHQCP